MRRNPVRDIRSMKIISANTIALVSLRYLRDVAKKYGFGKKFSSASRELINARPTAVVLHKCIEAIKKNKRIETIDKLLFDLQNSYTLISKNAQKIFPRKKKIIVLTHCHSTVVIDALIQANKKYNIEVYVTETRPHDQGAITAKKLIKHRVKVHYIIDSALGPFMKKIDFILIGADSFRKQGLVNKIGTFPLAVFSKEHKKPFYVAASTFKIDKRKKFVIEERAGTEITHKHLKPAKIHNPAFDITPWKYVTKIITEKGIYTPKRLMAGKQ